MKHRDVGLMVVDTSKPGWMVLHADCNNPCIDRGQAEGQCLWDKLKVPDVVSALLLFLWEIAHLLLWVRILDWVLGSTLLLPSSGKGFCVGVLLNWIIAVSHDMGPLLSIIMVLMVDRSSQLLRTIFNGYSKLTSEA